MTNRDRDDDRRDDRRGDRYGGNRMRGVNEDRTADRYSLDRDQRPYRAFEEERDRYRRAVDRGDEYRADPGEVRSQPSVLDRSGGHHDKRGDFALRAEPDLGRNRGMSEGYGGTSGQSVGGTQRRMYGGMSGGMYRKALESRGMHHGRGPKNYQRDSKRIQEDVCEDLTYHHDIDATDIDVKVENGEVTLSGTVTDRYQKRLAEDIAEDVRGVKDVHNQLRVQS